MNKSRLKNFFKFLLIIIIVITIIQLDFKEIYEEMSKINSGSIVLVGFFQLLTMVLLGSQWHYIALSGGYKNKFMDAFMINSWGNILDAITPGAKVGGEILRFGLLRKRLKLNSSQGALIIAVQKLVSITSFYILTMIGILYYFKNIGEQDSSILKSIIIVFVFFGLFFAGLFLAIFNNGLRESILKRIRSQKLRGKMDEFQGNFQKSLVEYRYKKLELVGLFILGIIIWTIYSVKMYILSQAFNIGINFLGIMAITNIAYMVGMVPLLPGSIGSFEASLILLFTMMGVSIEKSFSLALIFRVMTFWLEFVLSGLFVLIEKITIIIRKKVGIEI